MFPKFTKKRLVTDECEIFFVEKGKGIPVVLLHGFPQTHSMWAEVAPLFPDTYHVICPDLRGYGQSGKPEGYIVQVNNFEEPKTLKEVKASLTNRLLFL